MERCLLSTDTPSEKSIKSWLNVLLDDWLIQCNATWHDFPCDTTSLNIDKRK